MAAIQTNISVTATQKEYYQKFVNLSVNETALPQGDATMRISPFDDYFLFTIYDEVDGEDTPIDLSNVGNMFINFIGTSDEINIKNHTQVAEVDLSQGQVLFRITKSDSKKILALSNNNFYISTKMISEADDSISDESVLYQGTWLSFDAANRTTLTTQIEEQRLEYSTELARLKVENDLLKSDNKILIASAGKDELSIQALSYSNDELVDWLGEIAKNNKSLLSSALYRKAKAATALGRIQLKARQQTKALQNSSLGITNKKAFYLAAARNLQKYSL
jgi:predicted metal-dependent hydrolase